MSSYFASTAVVIGPVILVGLIAAFIETINDFCKVEHDFSWFKVRKIVNKMQFHNL